MSGIKNLTMIKKAIFSGVLSGLILGLYLKVIEELTNLKVYTLLLNVDYIPVLNQFRLPELIEFGLHILISIFLSLSILYFLKHQNYPLKKWIKLTLIISILVGLILFPTTVLSSRTPEITDIQALIQWMIGHFLYGLSLGYLMKKGK